MNFASNITELIGNTPLVKLNALAKDIDATVLAKLESNNPGCSVKDRLALALINAAEADGKIKPDTTIIEPSSGNTGIGLAMICAVKNYKLIITMPESVSVERRHLIEFYGGEVILTPASGGMKAAIDKANELAKANENSFIPMQFENPANPEMHRKTTAKEIWRDTDGMVDIFVAGAGTGGTISGVTEILKERNPALKSVVVEPANSPVIAGGIPGKHKIQGIGAGFIPKNLNTKIIDEVLPVTDEQAIETMKRLAKEEGIFAGISSGANVFAALEVASRPENKGKVIVVIVCDTGERYVSLLNQI